MRLKFESEFLLCSCAASTFNIPLRRDMVGVETLHSMNLGIDAQA